ncbi:MAG: biotin/lipoyl-binding protein, partial [Gemmataceae bacterium]
MSTKRLRLLPVLGGIALLLTTVVGARLLTPQTPGEAPPPAPAKKAPLSNDALLVHGTVATEKEVGLYALSPLMAAGRVSKVLVHEGQEVKAGTPLYQFDDAAAQADLAEAMAVEQTAKAEHKLILAKLT